MPWPLHALAVAPLWPSHPTLLSTHACEHTPASGQRAHRRQTHTTRARARIACSGSVGHTPCRRAPHTLRRRGVARGNGRPHVSATRHVHVQRLSVLLCLGRRLVLPVLPGQRQAGAETRQTGSRVHGRPRVRRRRGPLARWYRHPSGYLHRRYSAGGFHLPPAAAAAAPSWSSAAAVPPRWAWAARARRSPGRILPSSLRQPDGSIITTRHRHRHRHRRRRRLCLTCARARALVSAPARALALATPPVAALAAGIRASPTPVPVGHRARPLPARARLSSFACRAPAHWTRLGSRHVEQSISAASLQPRCRRL